MKRRRLASGTRFRCAPAACCPSGGQSALSALRDLLVAPPFAGAQNIFTLFDNTNGLTLDIDASDESAPDGGVIVEVSPKRWYGVSLPAPATATYLSSVSFAIFNRDTTYTAPQSVSVVVAVHRMTNGSVTRRPLYRKAAIGTFEQVVSGYLQVGGQANAPWSYFTVNMFTSGILLDPAVASAFMIVVYQESERFVMQLRSALVDPSVPIAGPFPAGSLLADASYIRSTRGTWFRQSAGAKWAAMRVRAEGRRVPGGVHGVPVCSLPACRAQPRSLPFLPAVPPQIMGQDGIGLQQTVFDNTNLQVRGVARER